MKYEQILVCVSVDGKGRFSENQLNLGDLIK